MEQMLSLIALVVMFMTFSFIAGYSCGHHRGMRDGWRHATGGEPLDEKRIRREFFKIYRRKVL